MEPQYFDFCEVTKGDSRYAEYLNFRHSIFVEELHSISPAEKENLKHIETDKFDPYSRHLIATHKTTDVMAACVRMILPNSEEGLSVDSRYLINKHPYQPHQTKHNTGEISRMAISPNLRRRKEDNKKLTEGDPNQEINHIDRNTKVKNYQPGLILGMYREIYMLAQREGIDYCFAAMDKRFSRLLIRIGYPFNPVGPENTQMTPIRIPFLISQVEMKETLERFHPEIMAFMDKK